MRLLAGILYCFALFAQGLPSDVLEAKLAEGAEALKKRNYQQAEEIYREVLDQAGDLRAFRGLIDTLSAQKRYGAAAAMVESAVQRYPDQAGLRLLLANAYASAGRHAEAIAIYRKWLEQKPDDYGVLMRYGEVLSESGNGEEAIAVTKKAIEFAPNPLIPEIQIAVYEEARGRRDVAIQMYERMLARHPNNPALLNNLAYALAVSGGDPERSLLLARRARGYLPDHPDVADTYGLALIHSGDAAAGLKIYEALLAREPDRSAFNYGAALAKMALGRTKEALESAQRAAELKHSPREDALIRKLIEQLKAKAATP